MTDFEFDFNDFLESESVKTDIDFQITEEVEQKRVIAKVPDMTRYDKMLVDKLLRYVPDYLKRKEVCEIIVEYPNTRLIDLLMEYVGLSEVLATNIVTMHRENYLMNDNYSLFAERKKSTFTKQSMKVFFSR
jgi:hypothetical protein